MLRAVNWSEKLGQLFGGHRGRILRILLLFMCALGILVVIYRARGARIEKEQLQKNKPLKQSAANFHSAVSTTKWVIVGNPDADNEGSVGEPYVCSVARVAREAGWKTIIIGDKLECCRMPDCYPINKGQFLRMSYRTASVLKNLIEAGKNDKVYKEAIRNLAFIWVIHRGARYIFDAYVDEYIAAEVPIPKFEEELSRQLHTLALDESLALVEDRSRSRGSLFQNPYSHFGRPDVRLLPGGPGGSSSNSGAFHHHPSPYAAPHLAHRHSPPQSHQILNASRPQDFPSFRICEVRPPSIEKFLEIDEGWWDMRAPALVLPGDTMPPLCTRNTLFSPDVFWALPLLPDYATGDTEEVLELAQNLSRIPPWYIRGLWSQSLLGDLGGSIRLTLSRVPTLQLNQYYFAGGDYEPSSLNSSTKAVSSKLLKRWHCRSRSTFRCLLLMSKELSKSLYLRKNDLQLIEAWIIDLKSIHYAEPPMLPRRRSHTNPCLGVDGLHGVSFFPALEPNSEFTSEYFIGKRNDTLKSIVAQSYVEGEGLRDKRQTLEATATENVTVAELKSELSPPEENATFYPIDWSTYVAEVTENPVGSFEDERSERLGSSSYYSHHSIRDALKEVEESSTDFDTLSDHSSVSYSRRVLPFADKQSSSSSSYVTIVNDPRTAYLTATRTAKQLLQKIPSKSSEVAPEEFPILKAMAENMCPGFGPLIPYQPNTVHQDILLIVVFTNQHYDLIPTLEVLYRSSFPNILYCGHPHVSVDLFLRKYQTVEHRSFSFLPTYTRATYECVLGAMEMNYEVKGYAVITDETLMNSWNIKNLDKNKIWVSSSLHDTRHVPVTRNSWNKLDPQGQKLPRLLDGIINAWKLFSYILVGQDSWILEPKGGGIKKRSVKDPQPASRKEYKNEKEEGEILEAAAASYVPVQWSNPPEGNRNETETGEGDKNSLQGDSETKGWDLSLSDWDNLKDTQGPSVEQGNSSNSTKGNSDSEDVEVGEEEDESTASGVSDLISTESGISSTIPPFENEGSTTTDESDSVILATPTSDTVSDDNYTSSVWPLDNDHQDSTGNNPSTTQTPESSVGVPLYHVEHTEPPTPSTWHKPEEVQSSTVTAIATEESNSSLGEKKVVIGSFNISSADQQDSISVGSSTITKRPLGEQLQSSTTYSPGSGPTSTTSSPETKSHSTGQTQRPPLPINLVPSTSESPQEKSTHPPLPIDDVELKREMESLLDSLQDVYLNMLGVVSEFKVANDSSSKTHEFSSEVGTEFNSLLEDSKSHRISPREFRHIRCSLNDDGHQSDLCSTLRTYITTLGQNLGEENELDHDTIPMYYLPSWTTKPFYSVANVLLHFGVMDELALPLLFKGLALDMDWIELNRSPSLQAQAPSNYDKTSGISLSSISSTSSSSSEVNVNPEDAQYLHPFNHHKVYSDKDKRTLFCSNYLLKVFQM